MKPSKQTFKSGTARQRAGTRDLLKHSNHPSWKVGRYWDNSGTSNPVLQKIQSERVLPSARLSKKPIVWPLNSFDLDFKGLNKNFNSNSESKVGWEGKNYRCSTINYQNRDYNFITHTVATRPTSTTTSRQKGFGEYVDATRPFKKEVFAEYQQVFKDNPNVFRRQTGEFTKHQDNCVKLSGLGPFSRPF